MVMSTKGMLEAQIGNLKLMSDQVKDNLKKYVQDTNEPLEDRWKLFVDSDLGDDDKFIEDFDGLDFDDVVAIRDYDKYESVNLTRLVNDRLEDEGYEPERIIRIKESILKKFIKSYRVDW